MFAFLAALALAFSLLAPGDPPPPGGRGPGDPPPPGSRAEGPIDIPGGP